MLLPDWGPYTKNYAGVSHITDQNAGLRFDLSLFPGFYRRKTAIPNGLWESGYNPHRAAPDLSFWEFRQELQGQEVFCDAAYFPLDDDTNGRVLRCECVNQTDLPQTLALHLMASLQFPSPAAYGKEPLRAAHVAMPPGSMWLDALDFDQLQFQTSRPQDRLMPDGLRRGEFRAHGFVGGGGVGRGFGLEAGDVLRYKFDLPQEVRHAALVVRYRLPKGGRGVLRFSGTINASAPIEGPASQGTMFRAAAVSCAGLNGGIHEFEVRIESGANAKGGLAVELDGFVLCPALDVGQVKWHIREPHPTPHIAPGPFESSRLLDYQDTPGVYGLAWNFEPSRVREFQAATLDEILPLKANDHVSTVIKGDGKGHFTDAFLAPLAMAPQSQQQVFAFVCQGDTAEVEAALQRFHDTTPEALEAAYQTAAARAVSFDETPGGQTYAFSQERMAATLATNVVFPVYAKRQYIRHYTPGRWWDSLYTWDSGFIGLGLCELDLQRATDCLNAYVTEWGDEESAFIHHGSPVPVQHYLFQELWNRSQDPKVLEYFYPRLRQYYEFLAGRTKGSTTRKFESNLLQTWDYSYNSGGWDDYPPQHFVHDHKIAPTVAPVCTTAHVIRIAKILRRAVRLLGRSSARYDEDIALFSNALQQHSWDEEAGYFGYVTHDAEGQASGMLRHPESGQNFNRGLDGVSPLVAGICTPHQEAALLERLFDPTRIWSDIGLSAVDQSAAYYSKSGYWNGTVWMPHQWFIWKTMLDLNQPERAWQIAQTALDVWKREVEASGCCFEHFVIETGRGAGWHHFGGLSSPVLNWFSAYYRPGRLTVGLDTWIEGQEWSGDNRHLRATLEQEGRESGGCVLVCLAPEGSYRAIWNGVEGQATVLLPGVLSVEVRGKGVLEIVAEA